MQVNNDFPVVTAVIPCHNHERWIGGAISSIAQQTYPKGNLRIMVVDDGSTDNSIACAFTDSKANLQTDITHADGVRQLCGNINGIPLILLARPVAGGPSVARNLGILAGSDGTDIFAFLDSDDEYHERKIEASVSKFIRSEKVGAVYSDYDTLSVTTGNKIREFKEPFSCDRLMQECIVNCDSLILKDALVKCGGFDEEMRVCEDYDLWMRISERYVIHHIPESLVTIRVGDHSSSAKIQTDIWNQNWQRVRIKAQQRRTAGYAV